MSNTDRWRFGFLKRAGITGFRAYNYAIALARHGLNSETGCGLTEDFLKKIGIISAEDISLILEHALTVIDDAKSKSNDVANHSKGDLPKEKRCYPPSPPSTRPKQTKESEGTVAPIKALALEQSETQKLVAVSLKSSLQENLDSVSEKIKLPKNNSDPVSKMTSVSSPPKSDSNSRKRKRDSTPIPEPSKPETPKSKKSSSTLFKRPESVASSAKKPKLASACGTDFKSSPFDIQENQETPDNGKVLLLLRSWDGYRSRQVIRINAGHPSLRKMPVRRMGFSQLMSLQNLPLPDNDD